MSGEKLDNFYDRLPARNMPVMDLFASSTNFADVPPEWHVVITDIKNSTQAVTSGAHQIVNLVAAGSIIACLNIARDKGMHIPFFFGGDGGTMIIPSSILEPVMMALHEHRENTLENFGLELRVGALPVAEILTQGVQLRIAKIQINDLLTVPVILGEGLQYAEDVIKGNSLTPAWAGQPAPTLNLKGMECRWNRIPPPDHSEEVVSLLVVGKKREQQAQVFKDVLNAIETTYGPQTRREPISEPKLHLRASFGQIKAEMQAKLGRFDLGYLVKNWITTFVSEGYFSLTNKPYHHFHRLVQLTDTLVLDGRISTVISGTSKQRQGLQAALEQMEEEGLLHFGLFVSKASIMSCYVRGSGNLEVHFVDGADGGYSMAAKMLKQKLAGIKS